MINRNLFYHIYKCVILLPLPTLFRTSENEESFLTLSKNASTTLVTPFDINVDIKHGLITTKFFVLFF